MHVFNLEREQAWDPKKHVEKVLGVVEDGDVTVACWEPGQFSPNHCHPEATEIYFCFTGGGVMLAIAYATIAFAPHAYFAPFAITGVGLGYYMLHNTLQTDATQMTPEARGTAVGIFSAALYFGQTLGVAINAPIFDRFTAYGLPAAVPAAVLLLMVALAVFALVRLVEPREDR